jgi:hypothetical protein
MRGVFFHAFCLPAIQYCGWEREAGAKSFSGRGAREEGSVNLLQNMGFARELS